jgi:hypothetical protein
VPALALCAVGLAAPATAQATVTIGSPMTVPANAGASGCGGPPCTHSQSALPGSTVASPVNGTVVRWRFEWAAFGGTARLRVIRPLTPSPMFTASSAAETTAGGSNDFATSVPISIGDRIGIDDLGTGGNASGLTPVTGAVDQAWDPAPADGDSLPPTSGNIDFELYLNADVEPTSSFSVTKVAKQAKRGTAAVTVSLPNPGRLEAAAGLTQPASATLAGPGEATLILKPAKRARKRLRRKGKAAGPVPLTYTPSFGTASTRTVGVGLKLKRKPKG